MIKKIKSKKALGHLEIILSFVIFVSVIAFLLMVFKPLKLFSKATSADLDTTEAEILDYISVKLDTQSVKISEGVPEGCISIKKPSAMENPVIMKSEGGVIESRAYARTNPQSKNIEFIKSELNFYRIYSSSEFAESDFAGECQQIDESNYVLGVLRSDNKVSDDSLDALFREYDENYDALKEEIGLQNNFNLILTDDEEVTRAEIEKPGSIEVMARNVPIEILSRDGVIGNAVLNIRVWR